MGIDMESDDSQSSSASSSAASSHPQTPIRDTEDAPHASPDVKVANSPGGSASSSCSSSSSSSSSQSDRSKKKKKKSSSSSSSSSGSSSSSSSSSSDEDDTGNENDDKGKDNNDKNKKDEQAAKAKAVAVTAAQGGEKKKGKNHDTEHKAKAGTISPNNKSRPTSVCSRSDSTDQLYQAAVDLNISHEDLSDVSEIDMEKQASKKSQRAPEVDNDNDNENENENENDNDNDNDSDDDEDEDDDDEEGAISSDDAESSIPNGKERKSPSDQVKDSESANGLDELVKPHDEDPLDFEAEEGECPEVNKDQDIDADADGVSGDIQANEINLKKFKSSSPNEDQSDKVIEIIADGEDEGGVNDGEGEVAEGENEEGETATADEVNVKKKKKDEELEEGEVSDEDEKRPEETEPKPVCRFYTRGQCTWGMSCRFLHPGVTDKGNYTMFESLVRSVPIQSGGGAGGSGSAGVSGSSARGAASSSGYSGHAQAGDYHDYRNERPAALHHRSASGLHHAGLYGAGASVAAHHDARSGLMMSDGPVVVENAWERGLRTAKEMMRKANKRKEQDMDFEDKKMNLTLSPDELEKDPYYLKERGSSPSVVRELPPNNPIVHGNPRAMLPSVYSMYGPRPDRYPAPYMPLPYDDVDAYGRMARYRELPPHRMPHYEDDRRLRPAREVIVQRVESIGGRGDEWSDPWMRSKSIGRGGSYERDERRRRDRRSYSSNSSYSSSNSSQSDSSSDSSRSSSGSDHKRRYSHKLMSGSSRRHGGSRAARSPSQIPRRPRRSPKGSVSPSYKRSTLEKRSSGAHSPVTKRKKLSPAPKKFDKLRRRRTSSSSDSDSSDTSYSDSDSGSSSSGSSSGSGEAPQKRMRATDKALNERKLIKKPTEQSTKKRSPISIEIKKPSTMVGVSALASPTNSGDSDKEKDNNGKDKDKDKDGKKSRREELLKQLRAVEDAIAKKRSKLT